MAKFQVNTSELTTVVNRVQELASGITEVSGQIKTKAAEVDESWLADGNIEFQSNVTEHLDANLELQLSVSELATVYSTVRENYCAAATTVASMWGTTAGADVSLNVDTSHYASTASSYGTAQAALAGGWSAMASKVDALSGLACSGSTGTSFTALYNQLVTSLSQQFTSGYAAVGLMAKFVNSSGNAYRYADGACRMSGSDDFHVASYEESGTFHASAASTGSVPPPAGWAQISGRLTSGINWPDADASSLRNAGYAWSGFGSKALSDLHDGSMSSASSGLSGVKAPEITTIATRHTALTSRIGQLLGAAGVLGELCAEYAALVLAAQTELTAMVNDFSAPKAETFTYTKGSDDTPAEVTEGEADAATRSQNSANAREAAFVELASQVDARLTTFAQEVETTVSAKQAAGTGVGVVTFSEFTSMAWANPSVVQVSSLNVSVRDINRIQELAAKVADGTAGPGLLAELESLLKQYPDSKAVAGLFVDLIAAADNPSELLRELLNPNSELGKQLNDEVITILGVVKLSPDLSAVLVDALGEDGLAGLIKRAGGSTAPEIGDPIISALGDVFASATRASKGWASDPAKVQDFAKNHITELSLLLANSTIGVAPDVARGIRDLATESITTEANIGAWRSLMAGLVENGAYAVDTAQAILTWDGLAGEDAVQALQDMFNAFAVFESDATWGYLDFDALLVTAMGAGAGGPLTSTGMIEVAENLMGDVVTLFGRATDPMNLPKGWNENLALAVAAQMENFYQTGIHPGDKSNPWAAGDGARFLAFVSENAAALETIITSGAAVSAWHLKNDSDLNLGAHDALLFSGYLAGLVEGSTAHGITLTEEEQQSRTQLFTGLLDYFLSLTPAPGPVQDVVSGASTEWFDQMGAAERERLNAVLRELQDSKYEHVADMRYQIIGETLTRLMSDQRFVAQIGKGELVPDDFGWPTDANGSPIPYDSQRTDLFNNDFYREFLVSLNRKIADPYLSPEAYDWLLWVRNDLNQVFNEGKGQTLG